MMPRIEISKRLVLVNTTSAVLAKTINVSVVVWLHQYLLRRISVEEYSLLPLLLSMIVLLPLLTSILTTGLGRFVLEAYARRDYRGVTQIISTMFPLLAGAGLLILAGGWTFAWHVDKVLRIPTDRLWDARLMMGLLVFSAAIKPPCTAFSIGFYVQQRFVCYNIISVATEVLRLVLLFLLLFGVSTRVLWVVVANVAAELVMSGATLIISRRMIPALRFCLREIRWERAWQLMSFGGWNFVGEVSCRAKMTAIFFILNRITTPFDVTVFNLGSLGRRQIDTWMNVLAGPLYPVVTGMHALGARERIQAIYLRGGRIGLWILLLAVLPATIYAEPIIRLYAGPGYDDAAAVMVLMLACTVPAGGTWMIWQVANATGRVRCTAIYTVVTQLSILGATLYAVQGLGWGASGVALAGFVVTAGSGFLLLWPVGLRLADLPFARWVRQTLLPGFVPGCTASVVWAALNVVVRPNDWSQLGWCVLPGLLCYLGILLGFCLEARDREDLAKVLLRIRNVTRRWRSSRREPDIEVHA